MTRKVSDIIDGLRNTYGASNTSEIANEARALIAHIDAQAAEIERLRAALERIVRNDESEWIDDISVTIARNALGASND